LSQTDLGFLVGMTQATISYIETCRLRASSDQMGKLAHALSVSVESVFSADGEARKIEYRPEPDNVNGEVRGNG
jgi:DNA-binding XRE family transcriptional regulator